ISNILIYFLILQYTKPQYNPPLYDGQAYQYNYLNIAYPQYSNQRMYKNYNKWIQENSEEYDEYGEENHCACHKCHETIKKPSCRDVCPNCFTTPPPVIAPSYVFLPYPYPYPLTPNTTLVPTTQTIETTAASTAMNSVTTSSEASITQLETKSTRAETIKAFKSEAVTLSNALPEDNNDLSKEKTFNIKDKGQFTLTALRRTKPNWLPKYGIVPISDKFAEKLMLQLRSMRVLHPHKDNTRINGS
ncbi:jg23161, partial [Pararge aegeria aegeria]